MPTRAVLRATASHLPANLLTNEQLAQEFPDWDVQKIHTKTGISVRGLSAEGECASDLGVAAAEKLFAIGACTPDEIDYLLLCTQSPDYFLPTTACLVQHRLGLRQSCGALDFNLGCSGFVYGLSLAKGLVESGQAGKVLLITAETYTKYLEPSDRSVRTLFGDAAAATLIVAEERTDEPLGPFVLGTDGSGAHNLIVQAGGTRCPAGQGDPYLRMNGPAIFTFTLEQVPASVRGLLDKAGLTMDAIDYFVFHQANGFMLEHLRQKVGIPAEKFCVNMDSYGNTVCATIPMAMERAALAGQIQSGDLLMLVGFGVGYSWGAVLLRWP